MYKSCIFYTRTMASLSYEPEDTKGVFGVLFYLLYGRNKEILKECLGYYCGSTDTLKYPRVRARLQQTQLAGTCDRFGAPLDLEFAKDSPIVSFHRAQGEEQPLANLLIRESGSHEVEDFQLAWAEWLDQGLGRWGLRRCVFALLRLRFQYSQQFPCIVRHHPLSRGCGQEVSHRETFVDKDTD